MMTAARERLQQHNYSTLLIAVTVLTSSERSDLAEIGLDVEPITQVQRLAKLTDDLVYTVLCVRRKKQPFYVLHTLNLLLW